MCLVLLTRSFRRVVIIRAAVANNRRLHSKNTNMKTGDQSETVISPSGDIASCKTTVDGTVCKEGTDSAAAVDGGASGGSGGQPPSRPQFGHRHLTDVSHVFEHNAWDNVEWDSDQEELAKQKVSENSSCPLPDDRRQVYSEEAHRFWNEFYDKHQNRFFKDRHWLFTEFPELAPSHEAPERVYSNSDQTNPPDNPDPGPSSESPHDDYPGKGSLVRFFEVGCGVGNTIFPILQTNASPDLFVYGCDLSPTAIDIVRTHRDYNGNRCHAFVHDVTETDSSHIPFPERSLDVIMMIFVLSAISPDRVKTVVEFLSKYLKPGGVMLFRDYARYDLAQLRFKKGRCLGDNFYARGDGTQVYFFTQDEVRTMFTSCGLVEELNYVDRRLQVNRGRQLKMYRVWLIARYRKPTLVETDNS